MNKENFKTLLEDLYTLYDHTKISEIDQLVENNNGREFDVIKRFYFKHNFQSHPDFHQPYC